jgi:hypothetical protein
MERHASHGSAAMKAAEGHWERELLALETEYDALIAKYDRTRRLTPAEAKRARRLVCQISNARWLAGEPGDSQKRGL